MNWRTASNVKVIDSSGHITIPGSGELIAVIDSSWIRHGNWLWWPYHSKWQWWAHQRRWQCNGGHITLTGITGRVSDIGSGWYVRVTDRIGRLTVTGCGGHISETCCGGHISATDCGGHISVTWNGDHIRVTGSVGHVAGKGTTTLC